MNRINILNTSVDNYSMKETLQFVEESIVLNKYIHHVGVNAEKIAIMQTDLQLREYVNHSDLINPDGIGVIWASKILGKPLKERVAGIDLMIKIVELAHKKDYKVFFLGAKEDVVKSGTLTFHFTSEFSLLINCSEK